ncbi:hypothetical protein ACFIQG_20560 [Comamonas odontotermitis]|uniref:hypothetical protein n=1 Tax=Comamonas odontotermitis TaxID=379895 RepID=UPI00366A69AA
MIPSKHPKCCHPTKGLGDDNFRHQRWFDTDIRRRFTQEREDLQRPHFKLVAYDPKPTVKPATKQAQSR